MSAAPSFPVPVDRRPPGCAEARAAAASGAVAALRSACPTRLLTAAEIDAWLKTAAAGARFVYCSGPRIVRGPTSRHVAGLHRDGKVDLAQPRAACGCCFDYMIVKLKPRRAGAETPRSAPVASFDSATLTILADLTDCAARGARCRSNADLARKAGLATAQQASNRIGALKDARIIAVETVATGPDAGWRTVTVCASGRSTMGPPKRAGVGDA